MLIKESTLRRIIREEAYRSLREQAPAPVADKTKEISDYLASYATKTTSLKPAPQLGVKVNNAKINFNNNSKDANFAKAIFDTISNAEKNRNSIENTVIAILASMDKKAVFDCVFKGASPSDYQNNFGITALAGADTVAPFVAVVQNGASLFVAAVKAWCVAAAAAPVAAPAAGTTHTVVSGDSISKIAQARYGITPSNASMPLYDQLAKTITNRAGATANKIQPGDVIQLPPILGGKTLK
jgi:hypothetical protein